MPNQFDPLIELFVSESMQRERWTHEAHLIVATALLYQHGRAAGEPQIKQLIRRNNEVMGIPNTDASGYHETLTVFYIQAIQNFLGQHTFENRDQAIVAVLASEIAERGYPLRFYPQERLMSVEARRNYVPPSPIPPEKSASKRGLWLVLLGLLGLVALGSDLFLHAEYSESQDLADSYRRQQAEMKKDYQDIPLFDPQHSTTGQYVQVRGQIKVDQPLISPYFKQPCGCYSEAEFDYWEEQEKVVTYTGKGRSRTTYRTKVHREHNQTWKDQTAMAIQDQHGYRLNFKLKPDQLYPLRHYSQSRSDTLTAKRLRYEGDFCPIQGTLMVLGHLVRDGSAWGLADMGNAKQPFTVYWGGTECRTRPIGRFRTSPPTQCR